jgi:uncharacterized protein involved in exopolysaccharide biosynthesis
MRQRLLHLAARLYPASWRRRYGTEFAALLADAGPRRRDVFDVFLGAIKMRISMWSLPNITLACGLAGLVLATGTAFRMPNQYVSRALLRITPRTVPEEKDLPARRDDPDAQSRQQFAPIIARALSRQSLGEIIQQSDLNLYPNERARQPLEDVIENMKARDIQIEFLRKPSAAAFNSSATAFVVSFRYPDPVLAQKTTNALMTRLVDENFTARKTSGILVLDLLDPASLPRNPSAPNRWTIALTGLAAGLLTGILLALFRRKRKPAV